MSNNWTEEIIEHDTCLDPENRWIITGHYVDEKAAFKAAETAWEKRAQECSEQLNPGPHSDDALSLQMLADGDGTITLYDDYFHWNVETPHWYLHRDGTWGKMIMKIKEFQNMSGRYRSREDAEAALKQFPAKPPRFENYVEHLNSAEPPYVCKECEEKLPS